MTLQADYRPTMKDADRVQPPSYFGLEGEFKDPLATLATAQTPGQTQSSVYFLDTSVLLAVYDLSHGDLSTIGGTYKRLKTEGRLFVAARAMREYTKLRRVKLSQLYMAVDNLRSQMPQDFPKIQNALVAALGLDRQVAKLNQVMSSLKTEFKNEVNQALRSMTEWERTDKAFQIYSEIFASENVMNCKEDNEESRISLVTEMTERFGRNQPPGYRDKGKADGGVGDFLIWKTILLYGAESKRDVSLVTSDQKSDWWHSAGSRPLFARAELVEEFRREGGGGTFRLLRFEDFLRLEGAEELADAAAELHSKDLAPGLMSRQTLFDEAMKLVHDLRSLLFTYNDASRAFMDNDWRRRSDLTDEQQNAHFLAESRAREQAFYSLMQEYESRFKIRYVLIRDEIMRRIDGSPPLPQGRVDYYRPVNTHGMQAVADDLETMARLL